MSSPDPSPLPDLWLTGLGVRCPLGNSLEAARQALREDSEGLGPYQAMEQAQQATELGLRGAETPLPECAPEDRAWLGLRGSIEDALKQAGVDPASPPFAAERIAVITGTSLHGMPAAGAFLRSDDPIKLTRFSRRRRGAPGTGRHARLQRCTPEHLHRMCVRPERLATGRHPAQQRSDRPRSGVRL